MIQIPERVEMLFAKAVHMRQSGRMKSTIYLDGRELYILNSDHTILMQHVLPGSDAIETPLVFNADDYEGAMIETVDDQITFTKKMVLATETQFTKVNAAVPDISMDEIKGMFDEFAMPGIKVQLDSSWVQPLRDDLSHVEIIAKNGSLHLIQRDIYAGRVYDTWREPKTSGFGIADPIPDFGPIAARTADFKVVMEFSTNPYLYASATDASYFMIMDAKTKMKAIIAGCLYDELGYHHERREVSNGRKEQKGRSDGKLREGAGGEGKAGGRSCRRRS